MPEFTLNAEIGRTTGSAESRRLRIAGQIPGVLYGHGIAPIAIAVEGKALRSALTTEAGLNQLLELKAGNQTYLAMARELQRHPVRNTVTHVDFQIVQRDELMTADGALTIVGDAVDVRHAGGSVDQQLFTLHVSAKPSDIPTSWEVDITALQPGGAIRVADLKLPAGVAATTDGDVVIVAGHAGRAGADAPAEA